MVIPNINWLLQAKVIKERRLRNTFEKRGMNSVKEDNITESILAYIIVVFGDSYLINAYKMVNDTPI